MFTRLSVHCALRIVATMSSSGSWWSSSQCAAGYIAQSPRWISSPRAFSARPLWALVRRAGFFAGEDCFFAADLRRSLVLDAGIGGEPVDERVELLLREVDLLCSAFDVQEAGAHRDRNLVQVADLREDLVR